MKRFLLIFVCLFVLLSTVEAQTFFGTSSQGTASFVNHGSSLDFQRYYSGDSRLNTYWPILSDSTQCQARQDVLLQVAPFSCQPSVVRSDLLAEQNVPVFCQLNALRVNPLIDVKQIRNIRFSGTYPKEVVGVGFHPALASLRTSNELLGSPFMNNIGYAVVVLKKNPDEKTLPSFINLTLQARFDYYADNAFGIGKSEFLLPLLSRPSDSELSRQQVAQTFMNGKFSLRLDSADTEQARVSIYSGDRKVASASARLGQSSSDVYLPGYYCQAAVRISYDSFIAGREHARLYVDSDTIDVYEGSRFLQNRCTVTSVVSNSTAGQSIAFNCNGKSNTLRLTPLDSENSTMSESRLNSTIEDYFAQAKQYYTQLALDYPYERASSSEAGQIGDPFAQQGLERAIALAERLGKFQTATVLMERYLDLYNSQGNTSYYVQKLSHLRKYDSRTDSVSIETSAGVSLVRLVDVRTPLKKPQAVLTFGTSRVEVPLNSKNSLGSGVSLVLDDIQPAKVTGTITCASKDQRVSLGLGSSVSDKVNICGNVLRLTNVDAELYARVRVEASARAPTIDTNVTVGVGIEKRALKLTPDLTRERIASLNQSVQRWTRVSEGLGNVVKTLKGACFATAGVLTVKNFVTGLSGEALARQQVMRGPSGWTEWCRTGVSQGTYSSIGQCYSANAGAIDTDVNRMSSALETRNRQLKRIEEAHTSDRGLLSGTVDSEGARDDLIASFDQATKNTAITFSNGSQETINSLVSKHNGQSYVSYEEARALHLYSSIAGDSQYSNVSRASARAQLERIARDIDSRRSLGEARGSWAQSAGTPVEFFTGKDAIQAKYYGQTLRDKSYGLPLGGQEGYTADTPVQVISVTENGAGVPYLAVLREGSGTSYSAQAFYKLSSNPDGSLGSVTGSKLNQLSSPAAQRIGTFTRVSRSSCLNKFASIPEVQYYESEPYKGTPALVPIDREQGWYAGTRQTIPISGSLKAFQTSGRPVSFWLCNVGSNGVPDFFVSGFGDDLCQQFNYETGQAMDQFSCLSESETRQLVTRAKNLLEEASGRYSSAKAGSTISLDGKPVKVGAQAVNLPGTQCQDFMSPSDCKLLFNVCDPVICPSSRCNLGGAYSVSDVVQSGIIGSTLLCLPNAREGVAVPVCLTGIKAGLDSYVSILKAHQQCLQENLATGRYVGICDEITSVYLCEFFWRQAAPLAQLAVPKLVEFMYGQGQTRGGGEYRTVQSAWDNAQASVNFFTQDYGANAFKAFNVRSIAEAGSSFCRAFVSAKAPKTFESLLEPQSPSQFYAWFSTIPYSDVTVPATAQYKVFYHIYAGNDRGVYYSVYLKDPPQSSHYQTTPIVSVDNGYIAQGQTESQTRDFTAPVGYQQLCVRIDDHEECGFKQVSTSFALNYVRDQFVSDELTRTDITTERDCISGSLNPSALLTLNLQEAAQEGVDPAVYQRGISRICATANPGQSTDPARFKAVGYCGDRKIVCWLDQRSIDASLTAANAGSRNATLQAFENASRQALVDSGQFYSQSSGDAQLAAIQEKISALGREPGSVSRIRTTLSLIESSLNQTSERVLFNYQKARVLFLYGQLYDVWTISSLSTDAREGSVQSSTSTQTPVSNQQASSSIGTVTAFTLVQDGSERNIQYNGRETTLYIKSSGAIVVRANFLGVDSLRSDPVVGRVQSTRVNETIMPQIILKDVFFQHYSDIRPLDLSSPIEGISNEEIFNGLNGTIIVGSNLVALPKS